MKKIQEKKVKLNEGGVDVSFTTTLLQADKQELEKISSKDFKEEHGIFGIEEIEIGGEEFIMAFARTNNTNV